MIFAFKLINRTWYCDKRARSRVKECCVNIFQLQSTQKSFTIKKTPLSISDLVKDFIKLIFEMKSIENSAIKCPASSAGMFSRQKKAALRHANMHPSFIRKAFHKSVLKAKVIHAICDVPFIMTCMYDFLCGAHTIDLDYFYGI